MKMYVVLQYQMKLCWFRISVSHSLHLLFPTPHPPVPQSVLVFSQHIVFSSHLELFLVWVCLYGLGMCIVYSCAAVIAWSLFLIPLIFLKIVIALIVIVWFQLEVVQLQLFLRDCGSNLQLGKINVINSALLIHINTDEPLCNISSAESYSNPCFISQFSFWKAVMVTKHLFSFCKPCGFQRIEQTKLN